MYKRQQEREEGNEQNVKKSKMKKKKEEECVSVGKTRAKLFLQLYATYIIASTAAVAQVPGKSVPNFVPEITSELSAPPSPLPPPTSSAWEASTG